MSIVKDFLSALLGADGKTTPKIRLKGSAVKAAELHKNLFKDSGIRRAYPITRISYAVVLGGMLVVWKSAWTMLTSWPIRRSSKGIIIPEAL